jgi:hypothetical protein
VVADSAFIKCHDCGNGFHLFAGETVCPFCYALLEDVEDVEPISTEQMRHDQMSKDAGDFLTPEARELQQLALEEAKRYDESIERIPDPNESSTPLPPRKESKGFFEFFFGRGGKKK